MAENWRETLIITGKKNLKELILILKKRKSSKSKLTLAWKVDTAHVELCAVAETSNVSNEAPNEYRKKGKNSLIIPLLSNVIKPVYLTNKFPLC